MRNVLAIILAGLLAVLAGCSSRAPASRGEPAEVAPRAAEPANTATPAPEAAKDPPELPPDKGRGFSADKQRKDMGDETFRRLCPVDPELPDDEDELNPEVTKYYGLTKAGFEHPILALSDDAERNRELWGGETAGKFAPGQLKGLYAHALTGKAVEGATVLANVARDGEALDDTQPLIVVKEYGKGRVLWVGTDDTWLWRQYVGDFYFYEFWQNAIYWAAGED